MKYILSFFGVVAIVCAVLFCGQKTEVNDDYVRIHITANSNSDFDENAKYVVKDAVVDFLIPLLAEAESKEEAEEILSSNMEKILEVANLTLRNLGASYNAKLSIVEEEMPTRSYDDLVLESGIYKSLKIDLGQANGDNWWCVVFPAVCFVSSKNPQNFEYISKIWDTIQSVTQR